jgi:hypothetical protein
MRQCQQKKLQALALETKMVSLAMNIGDFGVLREEVAEGKLEEAAEH